MVTIPDLLDAVRDQLVNELSSVTDVTIHIESGEFYAAEVPSINIFPASFNVLETSGLASFAEKYGGIPITIRVRVSTADITAGQDLLFRLMDDVDPLSVVAALESDRHLGGLAQTLSWGDGWPWNGLLPYPDINGDGVFFGSELGIVVAKAHS